MLKKRIKYEDYNGEIREEDFYFNLSKAELTEMMFSVEGGLENKIRKIIDAKNTPELIKLVKDIIIKSYGEKSADGKRFIKSKELTEAFMQTEAYSELYIELATNDIAAADFIFGILPTSISDQLNKDGVKEKILNNIE